MELAAVMESSSKASIPWRDRFGFAAVLLRLEQTGLAKYDRSFNRF